MIKAPRKPADILRRRYGRNQDRYLELIHQFPLRRIESEKDYDQAVAVMKSLDFREEKLTKAEEDYLNVLADMVKNWDDIHHPIPDSTPGEMIQFFLDDREKTAADLAKAARIDVKLLSATIANKHTLSAPQILRVAKFFGIEPHYFSDETK